MRQKLIFSILLILSLHMTGSSQSMNAYIKAAEKAFQQEDYYSAVEFFKTALEFDSTRMDLKYQLAESARLFDAYNYSIKAYNEVLQSDVADQYPEINFWLGRLNQTVGNYEEAVKNYNLYLSEYRDQDEFLTKKAEVEIEASQWAQGEIENVDTSITITHLDQSINTPYSEFGAIYHDSELLFASMRYIEPNSKRNPPRLVSKILEKENGMMPAELPGDINLSQSSVGNVTFNSDRSVMYYTVCNYLTDSDLKCDIFSRSRSDAGDYIDPVKLSFNAAGDSITTTQPSFGIEPGTGQEFLVFSSDRANGEGAMDLWRVDILGANQFGTPVNLKDINTKDNEITPFFHNNSGILYFSTDGRISYGGYDVFSADLIDGNFRDVINVGAPVNSSFNDIYYSVEADEMIAHLSSNRTGSYYIDQLQEACCYDIYKVSYENVRIDLNILTFDALLMDSLPGATVKLIDPVSGDVLETVANETGIDHNFELKRGRNYLVVSEKAGFNPDTITVSTRGKNSSETITKKVYLTTDRLLLDVTTFDKTTLDPLPGTSLLVMDVTDGRDTVYNSTNPIGNDFKVYLDKGRSFEIIASLDGYASAITTLDTRLPQEGQIITRKLFLEKITFDEFLPLSLYFDNDRPDRRSIDLYTPKSYTDVYIPYIERKETFKTRYARRVSPAERDQAKEMVDSFFENEVKFGYSQLNEFLEMLHSYLKEGRRADLSIKGYTSPLAASRYNLALGQRRVSSVKNEFKRFKNGVLMPYITSGQLAITDISYGEALAPPSVSDRRNDTPNSIYSVDASKERRVEIVKIIIN